MESNPRQEMPTVESGEEVTIAEEVTTPEAEYRTSEEETEKILPAVEGAKKDRAKSQAAEKAAEEPAVAAAAEKVEVAGEQSEAYKMEQLDRGMEELRAAFEAAKQYRKENDPNFPFATPEGDQVEPVGRLLERIIADAKALGADDQLNEARKLGNEMGMYKFLDQGPPQAQLAEAPKEKKKGLFDKIRGLFG